MLKRTNWKDELQSISASCWSELDVSELDIEVAV